MTSYGEFSTPASANSLAATVMRYSTAGWMNSTWNAPTAKQEELPLEK